MKTLLRVTALAVAVILIAAFVGFKQQDVPITVTCGVATGGGQIVGKGITISRKLGGDIHRLATEPAPTTGEVQRVITGVFRDVLWYWITGFKQSSRGEKIDPSILAKEKAAQQVSADANQDCTPCPTVDTPGSGSDPNDSLTTTVSASQGFNSEQSTVAATAIAVGKQQHIPARGWVIAIATGLQESGLRNLTYGDRDSVGVLQQRAGWGTVAQRMNVAWAFSQFYNDLKRIPGWQQMPVTVAAQAVQVSGHPTAYAKWEPQATQLVASLSGVSPKATQPTPGPQCVTSQQSDTGTTMTTAAGYRKITDPTSGATYNIPIPAGPRGVAINFALDQVAAGKWYEFGSQGPNTWDCSGLVAGAWAKAGVKMTPQTEVMRRTVPTTANPQPGDLLYHPGHVQMYLGKINGQTIIVEAPRTGSRMRVRPEWMQVAAVLDPTQMGKQT